ncbi:hypothetical protein L1987_82530 [Smallanthus sonchifolius]|uniref:Uncharacterized protein n=1 Tax=Smallanthus sonchifolius TaxID=185202 RepID=A0ACB8YA20_9ASTR|nr:hypothetical protein L1987_82530 [Smallanthus sonchifolius]
MVSTTTRKLSEYSDDHDHNIPDQRTRPRLQIEPLDFIIQLPPSQLPQPPPVNRNQDFDPQTELTMCFYVEQRPQPPPQPQLPLPHAPRRNRKKQTLAPPQGKTLVIKPPFPWATDRRAKVHSLNYLTTNQHIETISGDVECKRCQKQYQIEYNLEQKYNEISEYVESHMYEFRDRAPPEWMNPTLPKCKFCDQENCVKPVVSKKKVSINWLFLFLGQMVGCCTLSQLKYFCKHTGNHRTGAKDRVLFLTYLELFKQVNPERWSL